MPNYFEPIRQLSSAFTLMGALQHSSIAREKIAIEFAPLVSDLKRSLHLASDFVREHDDERNAAVRLAILESKVSKLMNELLFEFDEGSALASDALDAANAVATGEGGNLEEICNGFETVPEKLLFLTNYCYEVLQEINLTIGYKEDFRNPSEQIVKSLEFGKSERMAGLTVVSALSKIIEEEFGFAGAKVKILNQASRTILSFEFPSELRADIEERIADFGKSIKERSGLAMVVPDPVLRLQMEQQLEFANMQLRHEMDRNELFKGRVETLESLVMKLTDSIAPLAESNRATSVALADVATNSLRGLSEFISQQSTSESDERIQKILLRLNALISAESLDEADVRNSIEELSIARPSLLARLGKKAQDAAMTGAASEGVQVVARVIAAVIGG